MADRAMVTFPSPILERDQFAAFQLLHHLRDDRRPGEIGSRFHTGAFSRQKQIGKGDFGAGFRIELLDINDVVLRNAVLFAAGGENCVCHWKKGGETATPRRR